MCPPGARVVRHPRRTPPRARRLPRASLYFGPRVATGNRRRRVRRPAAIRAGRMRAPASAVCAGLTAMRSSWDTPIVSTASSPERVRSWPSQVSAVNTKPVASFHAMQRGTSANARSRRLVGIEPCQAPVRERATRARPRLLHMIPRERGWRPDDCGDVDEAENLKPSHCGQTVAQLVVESLPRQPF
jgi:hypothetical protein